VIYLLLTCLFLSIVFATICESLRNFLRSRLAIVCRLRRHPERFGQILHHDEPAGQAMRLAELVCLTAFFVLFFSWQAGAPEQSVSRMALWIQLPALAGLVWLLIGMLPWALSRVYGEQILYRLWPTIQLFQLVLTPALALIHRFDTVLHRIADRDDPEMESAESFTDEIQSVVDEGEREGILKSRSSRMIQRVIELQEVDVRAVMTTRTDMMTIQAEVSLRDARRQLLDAGHSRIPVVAGSTDDLIGILYARDLLEQDSLGTTETLLRDLVRPALYVPETCTIDALLERMKQERLHMAIVLDEYGGVAGLVTLEDILEEIVGDIADEFDEQAEAMYELADPQTLHVDARMRVDELNDLFDLELPDDEDFDTLGGFVFSRLGRIPKSGDQLLEAGLTFIVLEATERKLIQLEIVNPQGWHRTGGLAASGTEWPEMSQGLNGQPSPPPAE